MVSCHIAIIDGLRIFYREAGSRRNPAIVLLHGFPSSSHMFRNLIPFLSDRFYVIAPDYPGFGNSSMPVPDGFTYTFHNISLVMEKLLDLLGIRQSFFYVHDYGGPVGFRIAARQPSRVLGFVIQNSVAHEEGLGKPFDLFKALWKDRNRSTEAAMGTLLTFDFTKKQYLTGACSQDLISPDSYLMDQLFLDRPGNAQIQLELAYDYRKNVEQYPVWQHYLRTKQPPVTVIWGKNDFIFTLDGAIAYSKELYNVESHLLCGGHFLLEEQAWQVSQLTKSFFYQG
ncbi:alpha/beta fold hydrolase [Neobacillus drentensis]|uniref:alpha/beta fold hydrolase n=1 Tax=Neobacillus drentensis TaxID=220684 RepID=UPI00300182AF